MLTLPITQSQYQGSPCPAIDASLEATVQPPLDDSSFLVIPSHLLNTRTTPQEKRETFFEDQEPQGTEKQLARWLPPFSSDVTRAANRPG